MSIFESVRRNELKERSNFVHDIHCIGGGRREAGRDLNRSLTVDPDDRERKIEMRFLRGENCQVYT